MFRFAIHHNPLYQLMPALLLCLLTAPALAADNTATEITITADSASLSRADNVSTYSGNVVLERGGLTLTGDKLTIKRLAEDGFRAELTGQPATLERNPPGDQNPPMRGHAARIIYTSNSSEIVLRGDAVIKRSGNTVRSAVIRHDLDTRRTVAEGTQGGDGRVTITLHPDDTDAQP